MVLLFYTTYISVDLAHQLIFHALFGKGGIMDSFIWFDQYNELGIDHCIYRGVTGLQFARTTLYATKALCCGYSHYLLTETDA